MGTLLQLGATKKEILKIVIIYKHNIMYYNLFTCDSYARNSHG